MATRFIIMADTHFLPPGNGKDMVWWNTMLKARGPDIADALATTVRNLAPEFVVHCGDFTDDGKLESFQYGKAVIDEMGCPCYVVMGNHDTWEAGTRQAISGLVENSDGLLYYARDLAGIRFVFLDCAYWITADGDEDAHLDRERWAQGSYLGIGPTRAELAWFEQELEGHRGRPTVVVTHAPIFSKPAYPVGSLPTGKPATGSPTPYTQFAGYCGRGDQLLATVENAPHVKAVFAGHWHICDVTTSRGVAHCQTAAMIEFPFEMRLVTIEDNRLSITTVGLDDRSFQQASLVPELNNGWVAGGKADRELRIPLD